MTGEKDALIRIADGAAAGERGDHGSLRHHHCYPQRPSDPPPSSVTSSAWSSTDAMRNASGGIGSGRSSSRTDSGGSTEADHDQEGNHVGSFTAPSSIPVAVMSKDDSYAAFRGEVEATLDDKASLAIVLCDVLLVDTARGIFFPTLWTHVSNLGGNKITLGYCVGAFSLGRALMSPIFGRMSTKHGYRRALMISTLMVVFGAMAYTIAASTFAVFVSQVLLGVGSGTLGVTRGYVADKTTPEQRTYLLAYTTAVQYAGFTCMPILGGFLSYAMGSAEFHVIGRFLMITQFTAPAILLAVGALILFVLLYFVFEDGDGINRPSGKDLPGANSNVSLAPTVATYQSSSGSDNDNDQYDESSTGLRQDEVDQDPEQWPTPEYYQQSGQTHVGDNGATGANGGEQDRYNYTSLESGSRTGSNASFAGGNFIENFSDDDAGEEEKQDKAKNSAGDERMSPLTAGFGDDGMRGEEGWLTRNVRIRLPSKGEMLIYGGFLLNVSTKGTIACFETLGAEYAMTRFGLTSAEAGSTFATFGAIGVVSLLSMRLLCGRYNDVQLVLGGLVLMTSSCTIFVFSPSGSGAGLHAFLVAIFLMYAVGYPIGHTAVLGLFSKVVGAQPQGTLMGWFGSAGALARTVFPVVCGMLSEKLGSAALFVCLVLILTVTTAVLFVFREPYLECVDITKRRSKARSAVAASAKA